MSCLNCKDLQVEFRIASPSDLRKAIAVVRDNVADGTLKDITQPQTTLSQKSFSELARDETWDDVLLYYFECQYCSEQFALHAETYHGSGGSWSIVKESKRVAL